METRKRRAARDFDTQIELHVHVLEHSLFQHSASHTTTTCAMPRFFCDYCDVYLTHDSMSVRKAHNSGRNHLRNVVDYYQQIGHDEAQSVIDNITNSYAAEGQAMPMPAGMNGPGRMPFGVPPPGMPGFPPPVPSQGMPPGKS